VVYHLRPSTHNALGSIPNTAKEGRKKRKKKGREGERGRGREGGRKERRKEGRKEGRKEEGKKKERRKEGMPFFLGKLNHVLSLGSSKTVLPRKLD
jgi:hypothetical protein